MRIYPAIDIMNGRCVRLTEGKAENKRVYEQDPLERIELYAQLGAEAVHIVDLDAALGQGDNTDLIRHMIRNTNLDVQLGGGIRSMDSIKYWLEEGVQQVIIGSAAIKRKEEVKSWIQEVSGESIVIGADVMNGEVMIDGWKSGSGEAVGDFIEEYLGCGAQKFLCTDVSKDGKLEGINETWYRKLVDTFPKANFFASGGVSGLEDVRKCAEIGMYGIVIGKAIYEGQISLAKLFTI